MTIKQLLVYHRRIKKPGIVLEEPPILIYPENPSIFPPVQQEQPIPINPGSQEPILV